jgi:hypothetical protein
MAKEKLLLPVGKAVKKSITKILNEPIQLGLFNRADDIPVSKLAALETPTPAMEQAVAGQIPFEGGQLPLWLRGGDLKNLKLSGIEPRPNETEAEMLLRKLTEAKDSGLYQSIEESGVQTPVILSKFLEDRTPTLTDGYHRMISAAAQNPESVIPYTINDYNAINQTDNIEQIAKQMGFRPDAVNAFDNASPELNTVVQDFISSGNDISNAIRGKDLRDLSIEDWFKEHQTDFMNYLFTKMPRLDAIKFAAKNIQPYLGGM